MTQNPYESPPISGGANIQGTSLEFPIVVSGSLTSAEFRVVVGMQSLIARWSIPIKILGFTTILAMFILTAFRVWKSQNLVVIPGAQRTWLDSLWQIRWTILPILVLFSVHFLSFFLQRKSGAFVETLILDDRTIKIDINGIVQSMHNVDFEVPWNAVKSLKMRSGMAAIFLKPQPTPGLVMLSKRWFSNEDDWEQSCRLIESKIGKGPARE